jgi:GrpB-like predicted nucleotidyltransferase (UPF0157 family)
MGFPNKLIVGGIVAGAALAYYVKTKHDRSGLGYLDCLRQLPGDAQRWATDARQRAARALEEGRVAAREREADIIRQLEAAGARSSDGG